MTTVMICVGFAGPHPCNTVGQYLQSCDFEACDGRGYVKFTPKRAKAHEVSRQGYGPPGWLRSRFMGGALALI